MQLKIKSQIQVESEKHLEKLIKLFNESNEIFMVEGNIITLYYNMTDRAKDDVDFVTMLVELNDTIKGVIKKPDTDEEFNKANKALDDIGRTIYDEYSDVFKPRKLFEFYSDKDPINTKRQCILFMVKYIIDEKCKTVQEKDNNKSILEGNALDSIVDHIDKIFPNIIFSLKYSSNWDIEQKLFNIKLRLKKISDRIQEYSYELDKRMKYYSELKDDYDKSTAAYRELNSSYNKLVKEHEELKKMKISSIRKTEKEMIDIKLNDFLHSMGLDKEDLLHDILGSDDPIIKVRRLF